MRRALRASRAAAFVVAQFLYLAFEEAVKASTEAQTASAPRVMPSVHERKTLPGTFTAPRLDLEGPEPRVRIVDSRLTAPPVIARDALGPGARPEPPVAAPREIVQAELPLILQDGPATAAVTSEPTETVSTLLRTLRADRGCRGPTDRSHRACGAATALAAFVDRDSVLEALEEAITAASRPPCVQTSAISSLSEATGGRAQRALGRMLGVARGRLAWTGTRQDRDLVAQLLDALDA